MIIPNEKQLKAISNLESNDDFNTFMGWIKSSHLHESLLSTGIGKEPERSWAQGKAQQLGIIVKAVSEASEKLQTIYRGGSKG